MFKKTFSVILATLLSVNCMATSVCATQENFCFNSDTIADKEVNTLTSPRYTNFTNVTAGLTITSDQKAKCSGSYIIYSNMNSKITVSLMRSTDGTTNWTAVEGESWSSTYSKKGNHTSGGTSSCKLSSDYYYCTLTVVKAYDSNGDIVETVSCWSSAYHL